MKTLEEINNMLKKYKEELKEKYGVKEIGIFGSYVRGEQDEESDLDILVEFERPIGFIRFMKLENSLSELLGSEAVHRAADSTRGSICLKKDCCRITSMTYWNQ